jgi:hypothetical protein
MSKAFLRTAVALALAGGASIAVAQTQSTANSSSARRFADEFAIMQSYSASGSAWQLAQPSLSSGATHRTSRLTFSELQAEASNSSQWQPQTPVSTLLAGAPADPVPPSGISIAQYQALSSESPGWQLHAEAPVSAIAANDAATATAGAAKPTFVQRMAKFFHVNRAEDATSDN